MSYLMHLVEYTSRPLRAEGVDHPGYMQAILTGVVWLHQSSRGKAHTGYTAEVPVSCTHAMRPK